jgi:hypothetical protein
VEPGDDEPRFADAKALLPRTLDNLRQALSVGCYVIDEKPPERMIDSSVKPATEEIVVAGKQQRHVHDFCETVAEGSGFPTGSDDAHSSTRGGGSPGHGSEAGLMSRLVPARQRPPADAPMFCLSFARPLPSEPLDGLVNCVTPLLHGGRRSPMKRMFSMILCLALVGAASVGATAVWADHGGDDNGTTTTTAPSTPVTCPTTAGSSDDEVGDDSDDHLAGTKGDDRMHGKSGDDDLEGHSGDDDMCGDDGDDTIKGGAGDDDLSGGRGNDVLQGQAGDDVEHGDAGDDTITGGSGHDVMSGGPGNDRIKARDGRRDRITCGAGNDTVTADRSDSVARNCEHVSR